MLLSYRGSVNRWECDENDHLNVRFCEEKLWQTLVGGLLELDLISATEVDDLPARIICQHLRFQQESRIATPISGFVSLLSTAVSKEFNVLAQLRHSVSGEPLCSALVAISGLAHEATVSEMKLLMACLRVLMQIALPRIEFGVRVKEGFVVTARGVIQPNECTNSGCLLLQLHARTSDSMPNLWSHLAGDERVTDAEGGAVVEFRATIINRYANIGPWSWYQDC